MEAHVAAHAFGDVFGQRHVRGRIDVDLLCGAREQPARLMAQVSFARHVGAENICPHVTAALQRAREIHDRAHEIQTQAPALS